MNLNEKVYFNYNQLRFVTEENFKTVDGKFETISLTTSLVTKEEPMKIQNYEIMVFIGKETKDSDFKVIIYRSNPDDKYICCGIDNANGYEENDEYTSIFFNTFEDVKKFLSLPHYLHTEFMKRPLRKIKED